VLRLPPVNGMPFGGSATEYWPGVAKGRN